MIIIRRWGDCAVSATSACQTESIEVCCKPFASKMPMITLTMVNRVMDSMVMMIKVMRMMMIMMMMMMMMMKMRLTNTGAHLHHKLRPPTRPIVRFPVPPPWHRLQCLHLCWRGRSLVFNFNRQVRGLSIRIFGVGDV